MYTRAKPPVAPAMAGPAQDLVDSEAVKLGTGAALVYHGYKRTGSIVWALLYGVAGKRYPAIALPVALAQGFGQRKGCP